MSREKLADTFEEIKGVVLDPDNKNFLLLFHSNPDGDAIGSALGAKFLLEKMWKQKYGTAMLGKRVFVYSSDELPKKFAFLPGFDGIVVSKNLPNVDVTIVMESSSLNRAGFPLLSSKTVINIDHHVINDNYGDINWVDSNKAAACQMIYDILIYFGVELDFDIAVCLYVGILTDTGRFQYSNTTIEIYDIIRNLVEQGINVNEIFTRIYGSKTLTQVKFMQIVLRNIEFFCDNKIIISHIDESDIEAFDIKSDDMDGAVEYLRDIENVEVSMFIKPQIDTYKISFRSKGKVRLSELVKLYDGGGHVFAAGCEIKKQDLDEAKNRILENLKSQISKKFPI